MASSAGQPAAGAACTYTFALLIEGIEPSTGQQGVWRRSSSNLPSRGSVQANTTSGASVHAGSSSRMSRAMTSPSLCGTVLSEACGMMGKEIHVLIRARARGCDCFAMICPSHPRRTTRISPLLFSSMIFAKMPDQRMS